MDRVDADLGLIHLVERILKGLDGTLDVGLDDQVELLDLGVGDGLEEILERHVLHAALLLDAGLERALLGELARVAVVLEHAELVTGVGHGLQAQDLDGVGRTGLGDGAALGVEHGADAAIGEAGNQRIAHVQGTAGHEHGSDRAAALIELGLEDVAGGKGVRVGLELEHVGLEQHGLQKVVDTDLLLGRDVDEHVLSAPLLGDDAVLGELLAHAVGVGAGLIDLVDGDDDGYAGGLGVVDRLDGLGHDAVVGGDDQDDDVGHLGAAGTHGRKGGVARGIDEGDLAVVDHDLRSADGLRNAARLAGSDAGVTDGVEQARLTVVDVTHDGDDRGAGLKVGGIVVEREGVLLLGGDDLDLTAQVVGNELDEVVRHGLCHGERRAQQEQALDDVVGRNVERLGELLDGNALGDLDGVEVLGVHALGQRLLNLALLLSLCSLALALLLTLLAATGGLARGLLDGGTSLLEHLLAAVLLGLASHAAVVVLFVVVTALALLALALLVGVGEVHAGSDVVAGVGAMAVRTALGGVALGAVVGGVAIVATAAATIVVAATTVAAFGGALGLRLVLGVLLLLEHGLLRGDLVEQRTEARTGIGSGNGAALGLAGSLLLLAGKALLLGLLLGLGLGAGGLLGGLGGCELAALLLASLLGSDALALGLGGACGLLGGSGLLLGLLGGLDFLGAGLDHRGELLADHGDVSVLQGGGSGLSGNLHIGEMTHQFLGGHAELFGQGGHTDFCHMTSPTLSGTLGA